MSLDGWFEAWHRWRVLGADVPPIVDLALRPLPQSMVQCSFTVNGLRDPFGEPSTPLAGNARRDRRPRESLLFHTTRSLGALGRVSPAWRETIRCSPCSHERRGHSDHASTTEKAIHFNSDDRLSAALAAFEDFRVELNKGLSDAWDAYYDGTVQKSCSDEAALARMGALAAIEHACVHLAGAASLADSADFESKGCVRSILDV